MSSTNDSGSIDSNLTPSTSTSHTSLIDCNQQVLVDCHSPLPTLATEACMMGQYWDVAPPVDPALAWKLQLLPVLDHGASQVLGALVKGSFQGSEVEQADTASLGLFEETRLLYSRTGIFLDTLEAPAADAAHEEIVHKANVATFFSQILANDRPDLLLLNRHFLDCFVPMGRELVPWQADLLLILKTQAYMVCYMPGDNVSNGQVVEELFPLDLADRLVARHPHQRFLTKSEGSFVENAMARRHLLLSEEKNPYLLPGLQEKYNWSVFIDEARRALPRVVDPALMPHSQLQHTSISGEGIWPGERYSAASASATHPPTPSRDISYPGMGPPSNSTSQEYFSGWTPGQPNVAMDQYNRGMETPMPSMQPSDPSGPSVPPTHENPSTTAALYRQARLMMNEPLAPRHKRTATGSSRRRPWSEEEEETLLNGLDYVKGPHWSQIQRLYGQKGLVNDVLKDRNQVQLKDKARNLKLFFIKAGIPVPETLQKVTGDVKKRKREDELRPDEAGPEDDSDQT